MQYEMWLKIICRHCLNLDKFCLFNMENWFLSTTPQELKGLDSQKAQEVHSDSRRNSCHSRALLPLQSLLGKLRYRLNRTEQEIRRNSESSSPFKEAALPSAWNAPHTHTPYFQNQRALLFSCSSGFSQTGQILLTHASKSLYFSSLTFSQLMFMLVSKILMTSAPSPRNKVSTLSFSNWTPAQYIKNSLIKFS